MDFETAKTVAAFGGLALGVLNMGVSVYKDFLRGPKLTLSVDRFSIRCVTEGLYDFQLDLSLGGHAKPVHLRTLDLSNPKANLENSRRSTSLSRALKFTGADHLNLSSDEFASTIKQYMDQTPLHIGSLTVQPDDRVQITLADRIELFRHSDGYDDLPLTGWNLCAGYGKSSSLSVPCNATAHPNGQSGYFSS